MIERTIMTYANGQEGFRQVVAGLVNVKTGDDFVSEVVVKNSDEGTIEKKVNIRAKVADVVNSIGFDGEQIQNRFIDLQLDAVSAKAVYDAHVAIQKEEAEAKAAAEEAAKIGNEGKPGPGQPGLGPHIPQNPPTPENK